MQVYDIKFVIFTRRTVYYIRYSDYARAWTAEEWILGARDLPFSKPSTNPPVKNGTGLFSWGKKIGHGM
jgi:uncharacterized protein with NRDE domain